MCHIRKEIELNQEFHYVEFDESLKEAWCKLQTQVCLFENLEEARKKWDNMLTRDKDFFSKHFLFVANENNELVGSAGLWFGNDFEEKYDYIKKAPLLLLDDIGAEYLTPWARDEILGTILQYRMDEELPTFFTSNMNLKQLEEHFSITSVGKEEIKARRMIERIKSLTNDFELIGESNRK